MRVKRVNRYYCDYCKVSKGTKQSMEKHEMGCTNNLDRKCKMCETAGFKQVDIREVLKGIPIIKFDDFRGEDKYDKFNKAHDDILHYIESMTHCPTCKLAILRHSGNDMGNFTSFDYKEEVKELWEDLKEDNDAW